MANKISNGVASKVLPRKITKAF